ncbi:MAG TPA: malto-oligosyltrehalose synthase, partial [Longimicrobiales bacterium]
MRVPTSTYRLQVNADFPFARVTELIDYFKRLGVGDLYFAPVFQARPRSPHGYDVINPGRFNREVGDEAEFEALSRALRAERIGLVLDIVPNHMAASEDNPWWRDILEHGQSSLASRFFDVEWDAPGCEDRIVLPVLGRELSDALAAGEVKIAYHDGELVTAYFTRRFPLDPGTYGLVLRNVDVSTAPLVAAAEAIAPRSNASPHEKESRRISGNALEQQLRIWAGQNRNRQRLEQALASLQPDDVAGILAAQAYRLEFWRTGTRRINYRRFFDITDLAGVRVEDDDVFLTTHALILQLIRTGQIDGVRIDHVDGLRDPAGYLQKLRDTIADSYVIVEKILAPGEELREGWAVEGTTGYDFTGLVAGYYCEPDGLARLRSAYHERTGLPRFAEIVYRKKKYVMDALFAGELGSLTTALGRVARMLDHDIADDALRECILEVSASLEVYRTYIVTEVDGYDRCVIKQAVNAARHRAGHVLEDAFALLRRVLLGEDIPEHVSARRMDFVANWQQFTGPVMAKGLEDTAFYTDHRLIALSEVGAHPDAAMASALELHDTLGKRARRWPYTLNASSTHDTKRSEDVRARVQVLTEMTEVWEQALDRWLERNARHRHTVADHAVPEVNEEILIYQTLLGVWPLHEAEHGTLPERLHAFLQKSAREAKHHSSWHDPDESYEKALYSFTDELLQDEEFLADFTKLQSDVAWFGALNSLSQLVLKMGAPGIPDIYQGNESWVFSLVDPDNRRPVDYARLTEMLDAVPLTVTPADAAEMLEHWQDGRIKMHLTRTGLQARRQKLQLFANGSYVPIQRRGRFLRNVTAFARRYQEDWALIVTGRFYSQVAQLPTGPRWGDTVLELPSDAPRR